MATTQSNSPLLLIADQSSCYPPAAFQFVADGLSYTAGRAAGQQFAADLPSAETSHVTGQQLSIGLREFAIDRFGMLAPCVLRHWNIVRTEDFGRIVYALIQEGRLHKSPDDSIEDFNSVFDFDEAFAPKALAARIAVS